MERPPSGCSQWTGCHSTPIDADAPPHGDRKLTDKTNWLSYPFGVLVNARGRRFFDEHAGVPVIAGADTGYGNALNVRRTVREFERAGVADLHLEDQVFPKRCGHYDDKAVVPTAEMVQKLRAARDAAQDADLVIIARTDAIAVEGTVMAKSRIGVVGGR